jgi:hypothetical protein
MKLKLQILKDRYAIFRFEPDSEIPDWIKNSDFYSFSKTKNELSVVGRNPERPFEELNVNQDWRILKIPGPLNFSLTGIIAEISGILGKSNIPVFIISTYDTDYFMVKDQDLAKSIDSLEAFGHEITFEN